MELTRILKTLSRRRRLVALGAGVALFAAMLSVYQVGLIPPSLKSRTNVFATASTQILVDTPDSTFADIANDIEPLEIRAGVFARFLTSPEAIALIGREANLPSDSIEAQGPYEMNLPLFQQEPTAERRSSQIIGEGALYRLRFENNPELPIISVFAQAPTQGEAVALAAAVPSALRAYVERIQAKQHTPVEHQVEIRKLGHAVGGVVNANANLQIALLVFTVVMAGWCMLLIPGHTIARGWREPAGDDNRHSTGAVDKSNNGVGRGEELLRLSPEHERAP